MVKTAFLLIFRKLRLSQAWSYKAPLLLCVPYTFLYATHASLTFSLAAIFFSLCTGIGAAGLGYFINDLADRRSDRIAGIANGAEGLSRLQITFIIGFFGTAFLLPWTIFFPVNLLLTGLLAVQILLYLAYAAPPLRLKNRGLAGLLADASYAHVNPALIGAYTFFLVTARGYAYVYPYCWTLLAWQFIYGLRGILQHQLADFQHDRTAGSKTFVVVYGEKTARRLVKQGLVPLEIIAFLSHTLVLSLTFPALYVLWPLYALIILLTRQPWLYTFFDYYYLRWLPVFLLSYLCVRDPGMSLLFFLHLALFPNGLTPILKSWTQYKKEKYIS